MELNREIRRSEKVAGEMSKRVRKLSHGGWTFRTVKKPIMGMVGHYVWVC